MSRADSHCLDDGAAFDRLVVLRIYKVENVYQGWSFSSFGFAVRRVDIRLIVACFFIVIAVRLVIFFGDDACCSVTLSPPPSPPLCFGLCFSVLFFLTCVLVQEENRPVLVTSVGLIRKHQLCQHVLVSGDGNRVLVLHDRTAIDVERRH